MATVGYTVASLKKDFNWDSAEMQVFNSSRLSLKFFDKQPLAVLMEPLSRQYAGLQLSSSLPGSLREPDSRPLPGTTRMSNNRKKAARNVFMVKAKILSAVQMKRTGTIITPRSIRRSMVIFSLRLAIFRTALGAQRHFMVIGSLHFAVIRVFGPSFMVIYLRRQAGVGLKA